jgi:multidrug efflux pump subunit AcrB
MKDRVHKKDGKTGKDIRVDNRSDEEEFRSSNISVASEGDTWDQKKLLIERIENSADKNLSRFDRFRFRYLGLLNKLFPYRKWIVGGYAIIAIAGTLLLLRTIGRDVLPKVNSGQFQVRLRAPDGTRLERTEEKLLKTLRLVEDMIGKKNIAVSSGFVGIHPGAFSTSPIYLFMAGPHEAVLQVNLKPDFHTDLDDLKEQLRNKIRKEIPELRLSFEPIELTDKILSQGSPTPIEVRIGSKNKKLNEEYANKLMAKLRQIPYLRDVQLGQSIKYPAINITIDRIRASQLGVGLQDISRSLVASTSSSRFTEKNVWLDERVGQGYSVQVEIPEYDMASINDIKEIPVLSNSPRPVLGDLADIKFDTIYGENDNLASLPVLSVTANINRKDLGTATADVEKAITALGELPRGLSIETKGLSQILNETLGSLQDGLIVAIVVIFLMLAANFQSFKVSLVVLSTVPAVLAGSLLLLLATGATLNLQSYMGIIMSVGVSIANSVLLITNAEHLRMHNGNALLSAREAAALRVRPILMTSMAMVAGMIPMAVGWGEGAEQSAPLARAVIGGLIASTFAALLILPMVFAWMQEKTSTVSMSLDPEDKESKHYIGSLYESNKQ